MKKNIRRVGYEARESPDGKWWMWEEICDKCGQKTASSNIMHSEQPDTEELDFCIDCYRYLVDNNISYERAYNLYRQNSI